MLFTHREFYVELDENVDELTTKLKKQVTDNLISF